MLEAIMFATRKHAKQKRIGGEPYILHPLEVAKILQDKGFSKDYQLAGIFHDLLEDTDATKEEILQLSNTRVLNAVELVTKEQGYDPIEYKHRIMYDEDDLAQMLKLADRLHNLRCALVASVSFRLKYIKETEEYYLEMAKETVFEREITEALNVLKKSI